MVFVAQASATGPGLYLSTNGGATFTALANYGQSQLGGNSLEWLNIYTFNTDIIAYYENALGDASSVYIRYTDNRGASWATLYPPDTTVGDDGPAVRCLGGFPYNDQQFYLSNAAGIYVTIDNALTWLDKTGDWAWGHGSFQGHVLVPNWTE